MFFGEYIDSPTTPLYAFWHGLTYTSFEYGDLEVVASGTTAEPIVLHAAVATWASGAGPKWCSYVRDDVAFDVHPSRLAFYVDLTGEVAQYRQREVVATTVTTYRG